MAVLVNKVTLFINEAAVIIFKVLAILRLDEHDLVVTVLVEDSHEVLDIEPFARVAEQLGEVAIRLELPLIELFASELIN